MDTALNTMIGNVPPLEPAVLKSDVAMEFKPPNNEATEDSDRFPDFYVRFGEKTHNFPYDHKVHLSSCISVTGQPLGFQGSWKRVFLDKTKWTSHLSQGKATKDTMLNLVVRSKPYCHHASDNEIIAKVHERYYEELDKNPTPEVIKKQLLPFVVGNITEPKEERP